MVFGTVDNHQDFITVYSEQQQGIIIHIYLPAKKNHTAAITELVEDDEENTSTISNLMQPKTILLVEDEEDIRVIYQDLLLPTGVNLLVAKDGEEGVQLFTKHQSDINLLILDMILPKIDGTTVFAQIRVMKPDIPVLLTSGYAPRGKIADIQQAEHVSFLQKPFRSVGLFEKIQSLL